MASRSETQSGRQVSAPQHFTPPAARELRAQSVHRLQVGLFGLAAMLLLVALANVIMDRARETDVVQAPAVAGSAGSQKSTDPLADIGVVPAAPDKAPLSDVEAGPSEVEKLEPGGR